MALFTPVWRREGITLARLGGPLVVTQLVGFSVHFVDVLMIGRLGPTELAAAALGNVIFFTLWIIGFGVAVAVSPMVSHAIGAGEAAHDQVRVNMRHGLWLGAFWLVPGMAACTQTEELLLALGQKPELAALAEPFVLTLSFSLPLSIGIFVLRSFLAAIDRTMAPLVIAAVMTGLNALFNYMFIYGNWGAPRLELTGAGIASSLAFAANFALTALYIRLDPRARAFAVFAEFTRLSAVKFREILSLAWPISASLGFELMLFHGGALVMGRIGKIETAAFHVALNVSHIVFMVAMGLSLAASIRIGVAAGSGSAERVRAVAVIAAGMATGGTLLAMAPLYLAPDWVAGLYLGARDSDTRAVFAWTVAFLPLAGAFALFDALQVVANQCLRGLKDVRVPMVITGFSFWGVGMTTAVVLALYTSIGAPGVWYGLCAGLATGGLLLSLRLRIMIRRMERVEPESLSTKIQPP